MWSFLLRNTVQSFNLHILRNLCSVTLPQAAGIVNKQTLRTFSTFLHNSSTPHARAFIQKRYSRAETPQHSASVELQNYHPDKKRSLQIGNAHKECAPESAEGNADSAAPKPVSSGAMTSHRIFHTPRLFILHAILSLSHSESLQTQTCQCYRSQVSLPCHLSSLTLILLAVPDPSVASKSARPCSNATSPGQQLHEARLSRTARPCCHSFRRSSGHNSRWKHWQGGTVRNKGKKKYKTIDDDSLRKMITVPKK